MEETGATSERELANTRREVCNDLALAIVRGDTVQNFQGDSVYYVGSLLQWPHGSWACSC